MNFHMRDFWSLLLWMFGAVKPYWVHCVFVIYENVLHSPSSRWQTCDHSPAVWVQMYFWRYNGSQRVYCKIYIYIFLGGGALTVILLALCFFVFMQTMESWTETRTETIVCEEAASRQLGKYGTKLVAACFFLVWIWIFKLQLKYYMLFYVWNSDSPWGSWNQN